MAHILPKSCSNKISGCFLTKEPYLKKKFCVFKTEINTDVSHPGIKNNRFDNKNMIYCNMSRRRHSYDGDMQSRSLRGGGGGGRNDGGKLSGVSSDSSGRGRDYAWQNTLRNPRSRSISNVYHRRLDRLGLTLTRNEKN